MENHRKTPVFELNNFRDQLGIGVNEYQRMHHFKARVLELAVDEISSKTDITVDYEQHKKGRLQDFHSSLSRRRKQRRKRLKRAILAHVSKNLVKSL